MNGVDFLDTNVLVYAFDESDERKQGIAQKLLRRAIRGEAVVSSQVLAEFATTLLHKFKSRTAAEVLSILDSFDPIPTMSVDAPIVRGAVEANKLYGVRFYDGMILAAADAAGAQRVFSEDLNHGQRYFNLVVENPFT